MNVCILDLMRKKEEPLTPGQYIRALRLAAGFTQTEAAATAEYNLRSWQHMEKDRIEPKVSIGIKIAAVLGVTAEDVWG